MQNEALDLLQIVSLIGDMNRRWENLDRSMRLESQLLFGCLIVAGALIFAFPTALWVLLSTLGIVLLRQLLEMRAITKGKRELEIRSQILSQILIDSLRDGPYEPTEVLMLYSAWISSKPLTMRSSSDDIQAFLGPNQTLPDLLD